MLEQHTGCKGYISYRQEHYHRGIVTLIKNNLASKVKQTIELITGRAMLVKIKDKKIYNIINVYTLICARENRVFTSC